MNYAHRARGMLGTISLDAQSRYHGLQLASAVVIAYVVAIAIGLPEQLWAVMSTLIVMRPFMGATFDAGWQRVLGTIAGALCGMAGVYLQHFEVNPLGATMLIVAALAFISAAEPALRSAPVAALIVLGAGGIGGHSALHVAVLRVAQIGIGVAVAMTISLLSSRYRAGQRLHAGCVAHLRRVAAQLQSAVVQLPSTEAEDEATAASAHSGLGRLTLLASIADRESRFCRRVLVSIDARYHRRIAEFTRRVSQDVIVLSRASHIVARPGKDHGASEVLSVASNAITSVSNVVARNGQPDLDALEQITADLTRGMVGRASPCAPTALLAAPLRLLLDDLQHLCRCMRRVSDNEASPPQSQPERQPLERQT